MSLEKPVRTLNPEVARKIAAGEVIDRPNAIIRELMDNAIDSGATSISVEISGGGIEKVRIVDNGSGMTREDLANCARPHATNKIVHETDLEKLSTLGFRGEALASIAAVSRLTISSGGFTMKASVTEDHVIEKSAPLEGTIVKSEGLFENIPAHRLFLKRPASEALMCKNTFIEKALPYTNISFRFTQDGEVKLDLPGGKTLTERFVKATGISENPSLFKEIKAASSFSENPDWSFTIIIGEPGIYRPTKKDIWIFINGRRVQEYSLVQAIEYGAQGYFPNGNFPVAAAFIHVNPELVDFNIHPAKKEVKFKDISSLHHGISSSVKDFFREYTDITLRKDLKKNEEKAADLFSYENHTKHSPVSSVSPVSSLSAKEESDDADEVISDMQKGNARTRFFGNSAPVKTWIPEKKQRFSFTEKSASDLEPETKNKTEPTSSVSSKEAEIKRFTEKAIRAYEKTYSEKSDESEVSEKQVSYAPENSLSQKDENHVEEPVKENQIQNSENQQKNDFHFLGSALGTFLIAEKGNRLYIIDKHAAHERTIFDKIMADKGKCQTLLIPYVIETKNENEDSYLESIQEKLKEIGFTCEKKGEGRWEFSTLNERWKGSELDLEHAIFDKKVEPEDLIYSIAAMTACKAAVKDGWILDDSAAEQIARDALELKDPHCPHGRPCFHVITREELFRLVRRTD